jgi:hypothetical protein
MFYCLQNDPFRVQEQVQPMICTSTAYDVYLGDRRVRSPPGTAILTHAFVTVFSSFGQLSV